MDTQSDNNNPLQPSNLPRWWCVLPSLGLIIIIANIDNLILNDFIEYRYTSYYQVNSSSTPNTRELCLNASQKEHNSSHFISTTTSKYPISTTMSPNDRVQESTARLNVYLSLAATIPAILTSILLGANCDRIGRKPLIILPYIGKIIRYFIFTAIAYYNLSDLWIILTIVLDSAFGTTGLSVLSSFAYVSDCTNEKTRTSAIIITDVCIGIGRFLPLITMGIYLQHPNFIQSMIFTFLLSVGGFVFCVVLQPESNLSVQHLNFCQQFSQIKLTETTKIFRVFFVKRKEHKQRSLLILVSAHLCVLVMICGYLAINYLYLYGTPFCFDSLRVGLISATQAVTMLLLTILYTLTVTKRTDHLLMPVIGSLTYMTQLVLFGFANEVWMIYLAVCIGAFYNVLIPVIRSRITKSVKPNEYAVVFILASVFESGGSYAISALANEIYRESLTFYSGLVFFVFIMFGTMAIILLLILYVLEYQSPVMEDHLYLNE